MGKSSGSSSPRPRYQPGQYGTTPPTSISGAPDSGYTRAGQGIMNAETGRQIDLRAMERAALAEETRRRVAEQRAAQARAAEDRYVPWSQRPENRAPQRPAQAARERMGAPASGFVPGRDVNIAVREGRLTPQQAMAIMRQQEKD